MTDHAHAAPDIIEPMVRALGLKAAEGGEFFGSRDGQPLVLAVIGWDPPAVLFKVRVNTTANTPVPLPKALTDLAGTRVVNVSVENGYGWLTFYDLRRVSAQDVLPRLDDLLSALRSQGLNLAPQCVSCGRGGLEDVTYRDGSVTWMCSDCLAKKEREKEIADEQRELRAPPWGIFLPLAVVGSALCWALVWFLFDLLFVVLKTDEISAPGEVMVLAAVVVALPMGISVGYLTRKSRISFVLPAHVAAPLLMLGAAIVGEGLYLSYVIFRKVGILQLAVAIRALPAVFKAYPEGMAGLKVMLLVMTMLVSFGVAKITKPPLKLKI